eukprot:GHRQ01032962.1.p1 GENE.GHRQ01032962.1~~GHRQ01032962.1.p1  ORF type:complete len:130 (+),score=54.28 GHRQ01032962.1:200-589(+)
MTARRSPSPGGGVKNSIHFEVTWRTGRKQKSIYMRKPPHYLVYQLALDLEAHMGMKADTQQLTLYGDELQPFERLSSSGVEEGDVIGLDLRQPTRQPAHLKMSKRAEQLLRQLMPASSGAPVLVPEEDD